MIRASRPLRSLNYLLLACTLLLTASLVVFASTEPVESVDLHTQIQSIVPETFSGQIVVGTPHEILYSGSFGLANRESVVNVDSKTLFDIGSITKTFTSGLILKLAEDGKLTLQQNLSTWFTGLPEATSAITIHQLLTHTSGLPKYSGGDREHCNRNCFDEWLTKATLQFESGEKYQYSNPGYSTLARIVEKTTNLHYETYLKNALITPLDIGSAGYIQFPAESRYATGYLNKKKMGEPHELGWMKDGPSWHLRGNGGLLMSAETLFHWLQANATQQVISHDWQQKQLTRHAVRGEGVWYGYGWVIIEKPWGDEVDHTGGNGFFFADARWLRGNDMMFTITNNAFNPEQIQTLVNQLRIILNSQELGS